MLDVGFLVSLSAKLNWLISVNTNILLKLQTTFFEHKTYETIWQRKWYQHGKSQKTKYQTHPYQKLVLSRFVKHVILGMQNYVNQMYGNLK